MFMKKIYLFIAIIFLFLISTDSISAQGVSSRIYTSEHKSLGNNSYSTIIRLDSNETMQIQGYEVDVSFNTKDMTITDISYLTGRFSEGLSDNNTTLQKVNKAGKIQIFGEVPTATGERVTQGTPKDIVQVTYTSKAANSQANIQVPSGLFYKINQDGSLSSIQATNDSVAQTNGQSSSTVTTAPNESMTWWERILNFIQNLLPNK